MLTGGIPELVADLHTNKSMFIILITIDAIRGIYMPKKFTVLPASTFEQKERQD
jgi:hypothetical protein